MAVRAILAAFPLEVMPLEIFLFVSGLIVGAGIGIILVALYIAGRGKDDEDS